MFTKVRLVKSFEYLSNIHDVHITCYGCMRIVRDTSSLYTQEVNNRGVKKMYLFIR